MILHGYFRSSAAYRVRIALNLKGATHADAFLRLRDGEQRGDAYRALNPQALVPALALDDGAILTQSLAICEYLEEVFPDPPLLPADPVGRARVRAFTLAIACEIHPLQNLKTLGRLRALGLGEDAVARWAAETIEEGLEACERLIADQPGPFCFGAAPTLADIVLVPQLYNARRFGVALRWPRIAAAERACLALPAFADAAPERQADAL
jgi:maleylpyruvate isomerase